MKKYLLLLVLIAGCGKQDYKVYAKNYANLQMCIDDVAKQPRGGTCVVDDAWKGTTSDMTSAASKPNVVISDERRLKSPCVSYVDATGHETPCLTVASSSIGQTYLTSPVAGNPKKTGVDANVLVASTGGIEGGSYGRFKTHLFIDGEMMGVVSANTAGKVLIVRVIRGINGTRMSDQAGTPVFVVSVAEPEHSLQTEPKTLKSLTVKVN